LSFIIPSQLLKFYKFNNFYSTRNLVVSGPFTILDQNFVSSSCDPLPSFAPLFSSYTYDLVNLEDVMNDLVMKML